MPRTVVGLDIGSSAVRAVELSTRGRTTRIRRSGRVSLPAGAVEGGHVRKPDEVTKAIKRLWHEHRFSSKAVRLGVGSGSVLVRQVELDWMPTADLRKAMRYLVADLLPVPVDEANIDHVVLEEVERPDPDSASGGTRRMVRVLLVATARDGVDETVRCVRAAGLRPTVADLSPLALVRAATRDATSGGEHPTEAVLDVGADKIAVAVHTRGRPRFIRVIPGVGGSNLTRAVATLTGADHAEAEHLKRASRIGTPAGPSAGPSAGTAGGATDLTPYVLQEAAQAMLGEVRDTLRFYADSDPDHPPTRVVLTGLGGSNPGFVELCSAMLGLPVRVLDTAPGRVKGRAGRAGRADGADGAAPRAADDLAVSVGLCLGVTA